MFVVIHCNLRLGANLAMDWNLKYQAHRLA
jgi:hypothetical protein